MQLDRSPYMQRQVELMNKTHAPVTAAAAYVG